MSIEQLLLMIEKNKIKFVDLRFTDSKGKEHHLSIPKKQLNETLLKHGKTFDGSSIKGWKEINDSDMLLMPDIQTTVIDPFYKEPTIIIRCDVIDPINMKGYERDPRSISKRAELFLKSSGIADTIFFGPEPEFFIFDNIEFNTTISKSYVFIESNETNWNNGNICTTKNKGYKIKVKEGYSPVPPVDSSQNIRANMCTIMEKMGLITESHHHEVAHAGQNEIVTRFNTLTKKADEIQIYKYVIHNVAHIFEKTATFMPKPIMGDNGSGMHCHVSMYKNGNNLFLGDQYCNLSETALFYIGGILKHAKALNALTNPTSNSYKRLIPGYEAPVTLTYAARNRSGSIRIPLFNTSKSCRIEIRFPDPSANPYLAFSAILMAGIDGIINKISPGKAVEENLYKISKKEYDKTPKVAFSLKEALDSLNEDNHFLTQGGVFTQDSIHAYMSLLYEDDKLVSNTPNPIEFDLYYHI